MPNLVIKTGLVLILVLATPGLVLAQQGNNADRRAQIELRIDEAKRRRIAQQCDSLEQTIDKINQRVANLKDKRGNLVDNIISNLTKFSDRAEQAALDTAGLEQSITSLQQLADEADLLWDTYQTSLSNLASAKCAGDDEAQTFHEALVEARFARDDVKQKMTAIRQFFTNEIKLELKDLRLQIRNELDDSSSETGDNTNQDETDSNPDSDPDESVQNEVDSET